jgi:hypothetical protein
MTNGGWVCKRQQHNTPVQRTVSKSGMHRLSAAANQERYANSDHLLERGGVGGQAQRYEGGTDVLHQVSAHLIGAIGDTRGCLSLCDRSRSAAELSPCQPQKPALPPPPDRHWNWCAVSAPARRSEAQLGSESD